MRVLRVHGWMLCLVWCCPAWAFVSWWVGKMFYFEWSDSHWVSFWSILSLASWAGCGAGWSGDPSMKDPGSNLLMLTRKWFFSLETLEWMQFADSPERSFGHMAFCLILTLFRDVSSSFCSWSGIWGTIQMLGGRFWQIRFFLSFNLSLDWIQWCSGTYYHMFLLRSKSNPFTICLDVFCFCLFFVVLCCFSVMWIIEYLIKGEQTKHNITYNIHMIHKYIWLLKLRPHFNQHYI